MAFSLAVGEGLFLMY